MDNYIADAMTETQGSEALKKLLDFCTNNTELARLETILGEFNSLKVLGVADFEIRHSNILAWLLDPNAHHGLGDSLIKNKLLEIIRESIDSRRDGLPKASDVVKASFADLQIYREWRNIDVFCVSPSNKIAVVVENKIHAGEGKGQLSKYIETVDKVYPQYGKAFIFLTLDGTPPKERSSFIPYTHERILNLVKNTVELKKEYLPDRVYDFIKQYLQVLEEKTMRNEEFLDLCTQLYSEHKEAITAIMEHGKPKLPMTYVQEFHQRTGTESIFADKGRNYYPFIPKKWSDIVPKTSLYAAQYLVAFRFEFDKFENHRIPLCLHICNFPDSNERERFVEMLDKAIADSKNSSMNISKSSKTTTTVYSKVISLSHGKGKEFKLNDYASIVDKMIEEFNSPDVKAVFDIVDGVVRQFWGSNAKK